MEALYLLVPLSIGIVFVAIRVFFWMSDSGQFDDMVGPGLRILEDRDEELPADQRKFDADVGANAVSRPTVPD